MCGSSTDLPLRQFAASVTLGKGPPKLFRNAACVGDKLAGDRHLDRNRLTVDVFALLVTQAWGFGCATQNSSDDLLRC